MRFIRILPVLFFATFFQNALIAQNTSINLDSLYEEVENLIGDSWYLEETKDGFIVTFCRSCKENYNQYLEERDNFQWSPERSDFFSADRIDSVSYRSGLSAIPVSPNLSKKEKIAYFTELNQPNAILQFRVRIKSKWTESKYEKILKRNDLLKQAILKEPMFKTSKDIFSDYRFWLPKDYWKRRTQEFDFYFERLPYSSLIMDNSVFIEHNIPNFFGRPLLVAKGDQEFYKKMDNNLESEQNRTLKIIALALGIHDYQIVN
ncbi:MAG: hypothetical protein AB8B56_02185 [Crocinitomicaceae bacterium]